MDGPFLPIDLGGRIQKDRFDGHGADLSNSIPIYAALNDYPTAKAFPTLI